jgi:hypothetical protein
VQQLVLGWFVADQQYDNEEFDSSFLLNIMLGKMRRNKDS